jgi:precorrin-3B methylase
LTVAVVSSGNCGIYGMAGLVLEEYKKGIGMVTCLKYKDFQKFLLVLLV